MPNVPYPYEVNGKLVTGNGSLIPRGSLSNRSLLAKVWLYFGQNLLSACRLSLVIFGQIIEILAIVIRITQIVCKPLKGDAQLLIFDDGSDTCDWNVEFCLNFKGWVFSMIFRYSIFRYIPWKDYNRTQF